MSLPAYAIDGMDWDDESDHCYNCLLGEVGRLRKSLEFIRDMGHERPVMWPDEPAEYYHDMAQAMVAYAAASLENHQ